MSSSRFQFYLCSLSGAVLCLWALSLGAVRLWPLPPPAAKTIPTTTIPSLSQGLSAADWTSLKQEHERQRRAFSPVRTGDAKLWQALHPAQQWRAQFDPRGSDLYPTSAGWHWGLELRGYGFAGQERTVAAPRLAANCEHLSYDWDDTLQEWYNNEPRGLEHGFTLRQRPVGNGEELVMRLGVRGDLRPVVQPDKRGVHFVNADGNAVITYTELKAFDAAGRVLSAWMEASTDELRLCVAAQDAQYPITIDPIIQQAYLKASNPDASDEFGTAVAISGDTVVIGARYEDSNATTTNGGQSDNSATDAGAAYVFVRSGGGWVQQAYLKASNAEANDNFGHSVAINGDTILVGAQGEASSTAGVNGNQNDNAAPYSGAVYVFVRNAGVWSQQAYLKASNPDSADVFGWSVAIDGDTAVVGAWLEASNATTINGNQSDNTLPAAGAAYVFVRSGSSWSQQAYLKASNTNVGDFFGFSVGISQDTIVVGAPAEASGATGVNGDQNDNTAGASGAAYVFVRSGSNWSQQSYLKASNTNAGDFFAWSVTISQETIVVGAPFEASDATGINGDQSDNSSVVAGAAYVFARNSGTWSQEAYLKASNTDTIDFFGWSVSLSGDALVAGAQNEASNATGVNGNQRNNGASGAGAAYLFVRSSLGWKQQAYLKASNTNTGDIFGYAVAIDGDSVVVGAPAEDSNSDQSDNSASSAGATYTFVIPPPDVFLTKTDNGAIFTPGSTGTYTITVSNTAAAGPTIGPIIVTDTLPSDLSLVSFGGTGWNCSGTTNLTCTHNGPLEAGASLPPLVLTVQVGAGTPTGLDSITNTAFVTTIGDSNSANNQAQDTTSVLAAPSLTLMLADPLVCNGPGGLVSVTATLTNPNQTALPASFTAMLPAQLKALAGTCNASTSPADCAIAANGSSVTWNGTLNAGQTALISYQAQLADTILPGTQLCVDSVGTVAGVGTKAQACFTINCHANGLLPITKVGTSDQQPGSLLVFPYYTSKIAAQKDTRLTISNVGTQLAYVHLFLVDGASCNPADMFLCLTPRAIFSFTASEYDPENTGFAFAVAVDNQGRPIANNGLIGNAFVDDGEYVGNYGAEAFWRYDAALTEISGGVALLGLNGTQYDAAPIQFAAEIQSPVDASGQKLVVAPLAGDLTSGQAQLSPAFPTLKNAAQQIGPGLASNEQEKTVSFSTMLSGGCLQTAAISANFPRVPNGLASLIPSGKMGLLTFRVGAGVGLLLTPRLGKNRWSGIRGLHKTAMGNVVLAIPVFAPVC